jgi:AraC family transcriptional regulator
MKYPNSIPLWHPSGELFPGNALCQVVLSSAGTKWNDVVLEQHDFLSIELADVMYKRHVVVINIGHPITCEFKKKGRFRRALKEKDAISFFPSCQPFFLRLKLERDVFGAFIRLGLDPIFVSRIAEGMELDSDRIELVEQRRETDLALRHIALALRAGVQTGDAGDRMYAEALSTALAVHLLREYGATRPKLKRRYGGLPGEKLVRAVEYIQDQLDTDLTVSGIAQAVCMSPYHFMRLFKESTGQSPHQYVIQARVRKAKELLATGKLTISEAAYHVGFVDQSHLTRHFKSVFGMPPKTFLSCGESSFLSKKRAKLQENHNILQ